MKNKYLIFILTIILCFFLTACVSEQKGKEIDNNIYGSEELPCSVKDIYMNYDELKLSEYSNYEYYVSGYVFDKPTSRNNLGKVSFTIVDNIDDPEYKLTVFGALSNKIIKQCDKVIIKGYIRVFDNGTIMITEKDSVCKVVSIVSGLYDGNTKLDTTTTTVTVLQISNHLQGQQEHYPISDEFIERYQQASGGYIALAKSLGMEVDKEKHSPNQKWHYFESWLQASLDEGTIAWEDDAKSNVYTRLLCPELLLWIYEACGVEPTKVKQAYDAAVLGKVNGTHISTLAKNMRACVAWEDITVNLQEVVEATSVELDKTNLDINVGEDASINALVLPSDTTNTPTWSVIEGKDNISITSNGSEVVVRGIKEGTSKVKVVYNQNVYAECLVTVIDNSAPVINGVPENIKLDLNETSIISPVLSKGEGTFIYSSSNSAIATITDTGVITGISYGEVTITITCVEDTAIYKVINVNVRESGDVASNYNIVYDLGTRVTAKQFDSVDALFNSLVYAGEDTGIVTGVSSMTYMYGGANGGRGETAWYTGNIIKFGTTSVNGSVTLSLDTEINYVKITGYVYDNACKIQIGDSSSTDWAGEILDNKTVTHICSDINEVSKDIVNNGQTSTIVISFASTNSLTIATLNKKPLFITSIEFGFNSELEG